MTSEEITCRKLNKLEEVIATILTKDGDLGNLLDWHVARKCQRGKGEIFLPMGSVDCQERGNEDRSYWSYAASILTKSKPREETGSKPVPVANAATIIQWLVADVFTHVGQPEKTTSDGRTQLACKDFCQKWSITYIEHHIITSFHHMSNGLVERAIQTVERMLRTSSREGRMVHMDSDMHKVI